LIELAPTSCNQADTCAPHIGFAGTVRDGTCMPLLRPGGGGTPPPAVPQRGGAAHRF
jgi:hypothetical protein